MPTDRKSRLMVATAAIITVGVAYVIAFAASWYNRKPFCNDFSLRHGYLVVPAWTPAPTFLSEPKTGNLLYLDFVDNSMLLVTEPDTGNHPVVASPVTSDGKLFLRFQDGGTVAINKSARDSFVHVDGRQVVKFVPIPPGAAEGVFTTARGSGDGSAFAQMSRIVPQPSG